MKKQNNQGITLIALVITIIVLLILAGVSLRLVAGDEGIFGRAEKAVSKNNTTSLQEEIELAISELGIAYYEDREGFTSENDYIESKLEEGIEISQGTVKLEGEMLKIGTEVIGSYNKNGMLINSSDKKSLARQITAANYGNTVNYSVTTNGVTLNNWKIFYNDGCTVTMLLGDYMPVAAMSSDSELKTNGDYKVYSDSSRKHLIEQLEDTENWEGLLTDSLKNKNATAKGAVDLETWVKSWNAKGITEGYTELYFATKSKSDGLNGYYVGNSENPTSMYYDLKSDPGYNNPLYFPDKTSEKAESYWLASPSVNNTSYVMFVSYNGYVNYYEYNNTDRGIRPAVSLPSSILGTWDGEAWNIE